MREERWWHRFVPFRIYIIVNWRKPNEYKEEIEDIWTEFSMSKFANRSSRDDAMAREILKLRKQIKELQNDKRD